MNKVISIITVSYNSKETIEETIQSVINQSSRNNTEYIIIDGGSNDGTSRILEQYKDHIDITLIEKDKGIYDAMNKGAAISKGDYIMFLNSDDILYSKNTIENIIKVIKNNNNDIQTLYGNIEYYKDFKSKPVRFWISGEFSKIKFYLGWHPPHPGLLVKRTVFAKLRGFNTKYRIASDYNFIFKMFKNPDLRSRYLDFFVVKMRLGGASNSTKGILEGLKELISIYKNAKYSNIRIFFTLTFRYFIKVSQLKFYTK
tara:strand:+ start:7162 stop:7932 length:771 start_codon:yes stop_codon:yes gene_type:complete